jgi:hypothetical protein
LRARASEPELPVWQGHRDVLQKIEVNPIRQCTSIPDAWRGFGISRLPGETGKILRPDPVRDQEGVRTHGQELLLKHARAGDDDGSASKQDVMVFQGPWVGVNGRIVKHIVEQDRTTEPFQVESMKWVIEINNLAVRVEIVIAPQHLQKGLAGFDRGATEILEERQDASLSEAAQQLLRGMMLRIGRAGWRGWPSGLRHAFDGLSRAGEC